MLKRRGTPEVREERGVQVQAAVLGGAQEAVWDEEAERYGDDEIYFCGHLFE